MTVHVDTGGTFLVMGPHRAKALGIALSDGGEGFQSTNPVRLQVGRARSFVLGDASLANVPVVVVPTPTGAQDFIIFGTNILQQLYATLDYPNRRLILSPRRDEGLKQKHLDMLPPRRTEVPFYMWGDHYMFARGSFGRGKDLNFFVDSGLVSIGLGKGGLRQACFTTTSELYREWGVEPGLTTKRHFDCAGPIALGPLEQGDQFCATTVAEPPWRSFGGVRIDGLLSHAFLSKYAWTIDFDRQRYVFSSQ